MSAYKFEFELINRMGRIYYFEGSLTPSSYTNALRRIFCLGTSHWHKFKLFIVVVTRHSFDDVAVVIVVVVVGSRIVVVVVVGRQHL
jgi:hypothetical protein